MKFGHDYLVYCFCLVTLLQWKIENESMFYVFVRPRDQPAWNNELSELSNDDLLDPAKGKS